MAASDFQINARVRGIFGKHWLDTGRLSVVTIKGNVYVGGIIRKLPSVSDRIEINEDLLEAIDYEIRRVRGVKRITYRLEEWRKDAGQFVRMRRKAGEEKKRKEEEEKARRAGLVREGD